MRVQIIKPYGFCVGVDEAIKLALNTKKSNPTKRVVVLGMLVHNNDALKTLNEGGVETLYIKEKSLEELAYLAPKEAIIVLSAHGHSQKIEDILNKRGISYIDATCPFVKKAQREIKEIVAKNKQIIYIGKRNHPEANAQLSISNNVFLYEDRKMFDFNQIEDESPFVIAQTTLLADDVEKEFEYIKTNIPNAKFIKGVCNASQARQDAINKLNDDIDALIIVGGKNSNNSKSLYIAALSKYKNKKVFFVENEDELNKKDLIGLSNIAVASGTSTPDFVVKRIIEYLTSI